MLEEEYAVQHFYGKNEEEAAELFFLNSEYYVDDLFWMGVKAYFYYISSAKKYLQSEEGKKDGMFIYFVVDILKWRYEHDEDFRCAFETQKDNILNLLILIEEIIEHQDIQDIDYYYPDLPSRVTCLIELCKT